MIAFDLDGVIADTYLDIRSEILRRFGHDIQPGQNQHAIHVPGTSEEAVSKAVRDSLLSLNAPPHIWTPEALHQIHQLTSAPIMIATARACGKEDLVLKAYTLAWCKRHIPAPFALYFRSSREKKDLLIDLGIRYWVDDRLMAANHIAPFVQRVFLVNRQWNLGRDTMPNVERVDDLRPVAEFIRREASGV